MKKIISILIILTAFIAIAPAKVNADTKTGTVSIVITDSRNENHNIVYSNVPLKTSSGGNYIVIKPDDVQTGIESPSQIVKTIIISCLSSLLTFIFALFVLKREKLTIKKA